MGTFDNTYYNSAVYDLSAGFHTFTFYGIERGTLLDNIQLLPYSESAPTVPDNFTFQSQILRRRSL
ncbi:hypothetical protein J4411_02055 [Candidatus Pacearchaeota archaeon]|nr:hypothetical protein [Candidatus Pacearchaeota archaeon]